MLIKRKLCWHVPSILDGRVIFKMETAERTFPLGLELILLISNGIYVRNRAIIVCNPKIP